MRKNFKKISCDFLKKISCEIFKKKIMRNCFKKISCENVLKKYHAKIFSPPYFVNLISFYTPITDDTNEPSTKNLKKKRMLKFLIQEIYIRVLLKI